MNKAEFSPIQAPGKTRRERRALHAMPDAFNIMRENMDAGTFDPSLRPHTFEPQLAVVIDISRAPSHGNDDRAHIFYNRISRVAASVSVMAGGIVVGARAAAGAINCPSGSTVEITSQEYTEEGIEEAKKEVNIICSNYDDTDEFTIRDADGGKIGPKVMVFPQANNTVTPVDKSGKPQTPVEIHTSGGESGFPGDWPEIIIPEGATITQIRDAWNTSFEELELLNGVKIGDLKSLEKLMIAGKTLVVPSANPVDRSFLEHVIKEGKEMLDQAPIAVVIGKPPAVVSAATKIGEKIVDKLPPKKGDASSGSGSSGSRYREDIDEWFRDAQREAAADLARRHRETIDYFKDIFREDGYTVEDLERLLNNIDSLPLDRQVFPEKFPDDPKKLRLFEPLFKRAAQELRDEILGKG